MYVAGESQYNITPGRDSLGDRRILLSILIHTSLISDHLAPHIIIILTPIPYMKCPLSNRILGEGYHRVNGWYWDHSYKR